MSACSRLIAVLAKSFKLKLPEPVTPFVPEISIKPLPICDAALEAAVANMSDL